MSYCIYLNGTPCDKCGHVKQGPQLPVVTCNLREIFDLALTGDPYADRCGLRSLHVLTGKTGRESEPMIAAALKRLTDPFQEAVFRTLEPNNGWVTLADAIQVMRELYEAAREYPEHVWEIL